MDVKMRTFLDVDRLGNETDRRFHAADLERVGGVVQVVPSAAFKLAPRTSPGAWGRNEQQLAVLAEEALEAGDAIEWLRVQRERWWNAQWRKKDPLYVVCMLSREQRDIATRLVSRGGFDPACFPEAEGPLHEHNDAVMLAEIAALGGTMLITSETDMVDEAALRIWVQTNRDRFPLATERLVYNADELFMTWASHPDADVRFLKSAIGAFWPERAHCGLNEARAAIAGGVNTLKNNKMPRFGRYLETRLERRSDITQVMREVQRHLPTRTREGEHEYRKYLRLPTDKPTGSDLDRDAGKETPSGYRW